MNLFRSRNASDSQWESEIERLGLRVEKHLGFTLRENQIAAGLSMLSRRIAELATGEGKTVVTVIPATLFARRRKKVWIATANGYLAQRDADWMRPIYEDAGISVAAITPLSSPAEKRLAYQADVTYGTISEFGFDDLRSRLRCRDEPDTDTHHSFDAGRDHDVLIVDEADSVLIDEACTPLIISSDVAMPDAATVACYRWCAEAATRFRQEDLFTTTGDRVALSDKGRHKLLHVDIPESMASLTTTVIQHSLERAIEVQTDLLRNTHYVVDQNRICLVDEYTGRTAPGRKLGHGRHQAIEAKEGLPITPESTPVARISVQEFAASFGHVCGLTATAWEDRHEFADVYGLQVERVAPHQPCRRVIRPADVSGGREQKWQRIAAEAGAMIAVGRPVLIGTRTVEGSERLSDVLTAHGIDHVVLNARHPEKEAAIIANAGQAGRVTVATNMAGRGTDIRLDAIARKAGGLHVVVSEPHAAVRIDRQLIGRSARQDDPGSARCYLSLDDDVLRQAYSEAKLARLRRRKGNLSSEKGAQAEARTTERLIRRAQRLIAKRQRDQRRRLTAYETTLAESLRLIGLDPHLDPLPKSE